MTYVMTKPCPICKKQFTKQQPTETVGCACGSHVWQGWSREDTPAKYDLIEQERPSSSAFLSRGHLLIPYSMAGQVAAVLLHSRLPRRSGELQKATL
jgi:hypothetical protein